MSNAPESAFTAAEAQAFCAKLAAWVGTLSERERRLLAAAVRSAGDVESAVSLDNQVEGYYTTIELLTAQSIIGVLVGQDLPAVNAVRDAAQNQEAARRYLSQLR
jgi:hypothetical protein